MYGRKNNDAGDPIDSGLYGLIVALAVCVRPVEQPLAVAANQETELGKLAASLKPEMKELVTKGSNA
ncbi:MAG: hypothetical protein ACUVWX_13575 [Kiritimatiellia bacterium]